MRYDAAMPIYEFRCPQCEQKESVFSRSVHVQPEAPPCRREGCRGFGQRMVRAISQFQRHLTMVDKLAEAEAKFGKEVDAAMGPEPDVGRYARRFETLAKDLPPAEE